MEPLMLLSTNSRLTAPCLHVSFSSIIQPFSVRNDLNFKDTLVHNSFQQILSYFRVFCLIFLLKHAFIENTALSLIPKKFV